MYDEENHGSVQWTWYNDYTYKAKAYTFQVVGKVSRCMGTNGEPSFIEKSRAHIFIPL